MRAGEFLAALKDLPVTTPQAFLGSASVLVISPHPDDESLGVGGLIAAACAAGQPVHVVVLTDGAGSHPRSRAYPPVRLVELRKAEAAAAVAQLDLPPARLTHLDLPDTRAPSSGPAFEAAVTRLADLAREADVGTVLVTWGRDPHCDHEAAAAMALALRDRLPGLALWNYPIWGWHLPLDATIDEPLPQGFRVDIEPWVAAKHAAIAAHASQMTDLIPDDPEGFRFTPDTLAPFLTRYETVFVVP